MNIVEKTLNESAVPRLQIRCEHEEGDYYNQIWIYELVYEHFTGEVEKVKMGETKRESGSGKFPIDEDGKLDLPFRDGVHIKHDALKLKLPAYAFCDDVVQRLDLERMKELFPDKYK